MTLAEQFTRSHGQPIEVDGRLAQMIYKRKAYGGLTLRLKWVRRVDVPLQGISVSVKGGTLRVADSKAKDVVLWSDTAPDEVILHCEGRNVRELSLWNCWRDEGQVTQAWVGNSGMVVEERDGGVLRFHCNSRLDLTFEDLVFDAVFEDLK